MSGADELTALVQETKLINDTEVGVEQYAQRSRFNGLSPLRLVGIRVGTQSALGKTHTVLIVLFCMYFVAFWVVQNAVLLGDTFFVEGAGPSLLIGAACVKSISEFRFLFSTGFKSRKLVALEFVVRGFERSSFVIATLSIALMAAVFSVIAFMSLSNGGAYLFGLLEKLGVGPAGAVVLAVLNEISNAAMFTYTASAMAVTGAVSWAMWMRSRAVRHHVDKLRHSQRDANAVVADCHELSQHLAVLDRQGSTALKAAVSLSLPPLAFFLMDFMVSWIELLRRVSASSAHIYLPIVIDIVVFLALIVPPCFATHSNDQLRSAFRRWFVAMNGVLQSQADVAPEDRHHRLLMLKLVLNASQKAPVRARLMQQEFSFAKLLSLSSFIFFLTVWRYVVSSG